MKMIIFLIIYRYTVQAGIGGHWYRSGACQGFWANSFLLPQGSGNDRFTVIYDFNSSYIVSGIFSAPPPTCKITYVDILVDYADIQNNYVDIIMLTCIIISYMSA